MAIDPIEKTIQVKMLSNGKIFVDHYDKLILATGAKAIVPPIQGVDETHVFSLRNITDINKIASFVQTRKPEKAVIIGTGFIGLEVCENLMSLGMQVTLVEKLPQVTPGLDRDMSQYVKEHLVSKGVQVLTDDAVVKIGPETVQLASGETVAADMVIVATGVKPNVELAKSIGIETGETGAIRVNPQMQTNMSAVYACGDCIEQYHLITGKPVYRPLGSTANKTGRIAGDCATGGDLSFRGILGTGIFKIFDLTVAQTGLSEREALSQGYEIVVSHNIKPNKPTYMGGKEMVIKAIADKKDGRLLGVQIVGVEGVDKRVDVFATAMTFGAKVEDLAHLDLAYAPPFSTTKDPVLYTGMILDNAIRKDRALITAEELNACMQSGEKYTLIDARILEQYEKSHIPTAVNIPQERLREVCEELDKNVLTITYCNKGVTGNAAQNILINKGFKKVLNISGGHKNYFKTTKK